jgi:hypothetical protein
MKLIIDKTRKVGAFLRPESGLPVVRLDLADRWGGIVVLMGMMFWTLGRVIPDEFLWNVQAARSFGPWA